MDAAKNAPPPKMIGGLQQQPETQENISKYHRAVIRRLVKKTSTRKLDTKTIRESTPDSPAFGL
jgi:hypothetical protein